MKAGRWFAFFLNSIDAVSKALGCLAREAPFLVAFTSRAVRAGASARLHPMQERFIARTKIDDQSQNRKRGEAREAL